MKCSFHSFVLTASMFFVFVGCSNPVSTSLSSPAPNPIISSNADLSGLTVSSGMLEPAFSPDTTAYKVDVDNDIQNITVFGTASDAKSTLSVNNGVVQSLNTGINLVTIQVTAQDGTTKDYIVTVTRSSDYKSLHIGFLKYVPSGSFQRDSTSSNISFVSAFRIGRYEITRAQFEAIMGIDSSDVTKSSGKIDPVQNVNWYHAIAFCNKLSIAENLQPVYSVSGVDFESLTFTQIPTTDNTNWNDVIATWSHNGYRLPTEMEWMWAAMGATGLGTNTNGYLQPFAGSTGSNLIGDFAVFGYSGNETGRTATERTNPVGSKINGTNELGLFDMSGNVWEWCWDRYATNGSGRNYAITGNQQDYVGSDSGVNRVKRGGGWSSTLLWCTVAYRSYDSPSSLSSAVGFRVVRP